MNEREFFAPPRLFVPVFLTWLCLSFFLISSSPAATTYYVDFDSGSDGNEGVIPSQPWKHAPGDPEAIAVPASIALAGGDIVLFKGQVHYRGQIDLKYSGAEGNPITYKGDGWGPGKAIIDGSEPLTGWTQFDDHLYFADLPATFSLGGTSASVNLHEYDATSGRDEFLWTAQQPDPEDRFFYDNYQRFKTLPQSNLTLTSLTDPEVFFQTNPDYWDGSSVLIWTNPNKVVLRAITGYSPATHTITFAELHSSTIYPDGRNQAYAVYSSMHALDAPGEYHVDFAAKRVYLYPRNPATIEGSISLSMREFGININSQSEVTIEGFTVQKHSGDGLRSGIGIGTYSGASIQNSHLAIRNNLITHNRHPEKGYGGIYIANADHVKISGNEIIDNFRHHGIFCSSGEQFVVSGNTIDRSGSTSLAFFSVLNSEISYNTISRSRGGHANGITIYIASKNILVAGNKVLDSASPITFQDSGDLYFFNNLVDSKDNYGVNEWARTSRGPWSYGEIVFLNNTFISLPGNPAMNIGNSLSTFVTDEDETIRPNTYHSYNNIIDAGGGGEETDRDYNIYTSLAWNQSDKYGWSLAENESLIVDRSILFKDPENSSFHLTEGSPAIHAGTDVTGLLPVLSFPDFDFFVDIERKRRPARNWSIGAYEYDAEVFPWNLFLPAIFGGGKK